MNTPNTPLPPFSQPGVYQPPNPVAQQQGEDPKPARKRKAAKPARKPRRKAADKGNGAPKQQRRARVAGLTMDVGMALQVASHLKKKEVDAVKALVELLNPVARPGRQRIMQAVAAILGN